MKGNKKPVNNITIRATAELLDFLRSLPNSNGIPFFNIIAGEFLSAHKDAFIEMFSQEIYDEHMTKYGRNASEMKKVKLKRDKEKQKQIEERAKLKKKELEIKERELDIREQNSSQREKREQDDSELNPILERKALREELELKKIELNRVKNNMMDDSVQKEYGKSKSEVEQDLTIEVEVLQRKIDEMESS